MTAGDGPKHSINDKERSHINNLNLITNSQKSKQNKNKNNTKQVNVIKKTQLEGYIQDTEQWRRKHCKQTDDETQDLKHR